MIKTLSLSQSKKNLYIRRLVFVVLILVAALLQNTPNLFPEFFGAPAFLLVPVVVCISMFERDLAATLMGIFAGALWDVTLARGDGYNALILMVISTLVGFLINYLMRNNLSTALLLGGVAILIYEVLHWLIFVIFSGVEGGAKLLIVFYLPSAVYTFLFVPILYFGMRTFIQKLKEAYPHRSRVRRP